MRAIYLFSVMMLLFACKKDDPEVNQTAENYFPPADQSEWLTSSPSDLDMNEDKLEELYTFLENNDTKAFIILKGGKIVSEKYWGRNLDDSADFSSSSNWYWASAAKTLTASLVGIAQEEGLLDINNKTSDYLGEGWTAMSVEKENLITVRNQLTMTTGLDYQVDNIDCTDPACLLYKQDAGAQWFYHNAPYTLLSEVVNNVTQESYNDYTEEKIASKIGMEGFWIKLGYLNVYWSNARSAARFGHLILNEGTWDQIEVIKDKNFIQEMTNTSQDINPSYGYLWWLNGKDAVVFPGLELSFNTSISPNAPDDLYAAMGKNGQFIDIVPSMDLVVVRMGLAPDGALVPVTFHDEMWAQLMEIF